MTHGSMNPLSMTSPRLFDEKHMFTSTAPRRPTQTHTPAQPMLIDRVTNAWRDEKSNHLISLDDDEEPDFFDADGGCCDLESDKAWPNRAHHVVTNKTARRAMLLYIAIAALLFLAWHRYVRPAWRENSMYMDGLEAAEGSFGAQMTGQFKDLVQVQNLHKKHLPGGKHDEEGKRRLIFVGDIHGCKTELLHLLKKVEFNDETDHLIATGDMISKGPDSAGVVDTLLSINASAVRGNHEDRILLASKSRRRVKRTEAQSPTLSSEPTESLPHAFSTRPKDEALLATLKPHHLKYLHSLPLILHIPKLSHPATPRPKSVKPQSKKHAKDAITHPIYVVHGGLVPAVPLANQDPYAVMNMRSIEPSTHMPSANRDYGVPWERIWGWYQARVAKGKYVRVLGGFEDAELESATMTNDYDADADAEATTATTPQQQQARDEADSRADDELVAQRGWRHWWNHWFGHGRGHGHGGAKWRKQRPAVVVYGHDSKRGLNLHTWSKGLDSGCVSGGRLTALVVDAWGEQEIVSVGCENYR